MGIDEIVGKMLDCFYTFWLRLHKKIKNIHTKAYSMLTLFRTTTVPLMYALLCTIKNIKPPALP